MFEGCSADTIMVVAVWAPVTNDCVVAVGTSVPCGVVITNPAKRKRNTITACVMRCLHNLQELKTRRKLGKNASMWKPQQSGLHLSERLVEAEEMFPSD